METYYKRGLLNKSRGMAMFEAEVDTPSKDDSYDYIDASFGISDCNRKITLDFGHDKESYDKAMYKLNLLIDELTAFKGQIQKARALVDGYKE